MPKVTVIMPSLNVVKYIRPCIESVLKQTLQNIEVLAIDAGSTDGTLEILQEYAAIDNRIKIILSDKKSYGYQINKGIALAQSEYIGIVETDDMIAKDMFEVLYSVAVETDSDYVKGRGTQFIDIHNRLIWSNPIGGPLKSADMYGKVVDPHTMPELLVKDIYLWTGVYKRKFISNVLLNETKGAAFQDQGFLFQTISSAQKAVYLDKIVYQYRQDNSNSSIFNKKGFHYLVEEYAYIEQFLEGKNASWISAYYQRMLNQCLGRFRTMAVSGSFWEEALPDMEIVRRRLAQAVDNNALECNDLGEEKWKLLNVFLKGASNIYEYYVCKFQKKAEELNKLWKAVGKHQVIIFGSGNLGKYTHALLVSKKAGNVVAYCDNNPELWNSKIQGVPILAPEESVKLYPNALFIISNRRNVEEMRKQIQALGVDNNHIYRYEAEIDLLLFQL